MPHLLQTAPLLQQQQLVLSTGGQSITAAAGTYSSRAAYQARCRTPYAWCQQPIGQWMGLKISPSAAQTCSSGQSLQDSSRQKCLWCFTVSCADPASSSTPTACEAVTVVTGYSRQVYRALECLQAVCPSIACTISSNAACVQAVTGQAYLQVPSLNWQPLLLCLAVCLRMLLFVQACATPVKMGGTCCLTLRGPRRQHRTS